MKYPRENVRQIGFWFEPGSPFVALDAPALKRRLPRTRFFLTSLNHRPGGEYPVVSTVVAASLVDQKLVLEECLSPTFISTDKHFIARLVGVRAETPEERQRLGREIGMLFERMTYKGSLREGRLEKNRYLIQLWTADQYWREIRIKFDAEGRIESITHVNPVDGREDE
jgi:hypothetical protein